MGRFMRISVILVVLIPVAALAKPDMSAGHTLLAAPIQDQERTNVLVLATPHLSTMADGMTRAHLEPLLKRLEDFSPAVIGVEGLPGKTIQAMRERSDFAPALQHFAHWVVKHGEMAQNLLGLDAVEARQELETLLAEWAKQPPAKNAERRRAAMLAIAAFDFPTAALQWRYLEPVNRGAGEDVPVVFAERMNDALGWWNEIYSVGVELAFRLGHQRLASIDDHRDKDALLPLMTDLEKLLGESDEAAELMSSSIYAELPQRQASALEAGNLLPLYAWMNSEGYARQDVNGQFHMFFRLNDDAGLGRERSALWEVRNLNIASNIRRMTSRVRDGNALVIIGAGHRPFLEDYLSRLMDVRIAKFRELTAKD